MNTGKIINVGTPTSPNDAVNKSYVDTHGGGEVEVAKVHGKQPQTCAHHQTI